MDKRGDVIDLATYRAQRAGPEPPDSDAILVAAHRGAPALSQRQAQHRRRMLQHLTTLTMAEAKA